MDKKTKIKEEAKEIYFAIKSVMDKQQTGHCQSWWLNERNFGLKSKLKTPQVNQRCKLLIKMGLLTIDKDKTSTSRGTSYRLTDKSWED